MKQKTFLTVKSILLLILMLLIYPAFLAARESKIEMPHKTFGLKYFPVTDGNF